MLPHIGPALVGGMGDRQVAAAGELIAQSRHMFAGSASSGTTCRMASISSAMGWSKSRSARSCGWLRIASGRRRSGAVGLGLDGYVRHHRDALLGCRPVDGEVVRTAQEIVVHAGLARPFDVDPFGRPARPLHPLPLLVGPPPSLPWA